MSLSELSASTQDYLKAIWLLSEWSDDPVMASAVANRVGVRLSTASDAVRRLVTQGLVENNPYGAITLTSMGTKFAEAMVRRHRLLETFLVEVLDYSWDEVHGEAEELEHAVSDDLVERISHYLGDPAHDPHGDPIPGTQSATDRSGAIDLSRSTPGQKATVLRVSDRDPLLLQFLTDHGIAPGTLLEVLDPPPFSQVVLVRPRRAAEVVPLGSAAAANVWVVPSQ